MSSLIPFEFERNEIRTVVENGKAWVIVADIAKAIKHSNPSELAKTVDEDDLRKVEVIDSIGRKQLAWAVNEPGLYQLLLSSNVEKAKPFRKWVTAEVLPTIRRTGKYEAERPATKPIPPQITALEYVDRITALLPNLGETSKQQLLSEASYFDLGTRLIPLPKIEQPHYTASELAKEFGITPNKLGRLANACGLKSEEFGEYRLSKSKYSPRQVEQFYYNEQGRAAIALVLAEAAEA